MKQQKIIIIAIIILISGAISFFFIRPVISSIWQSWKDYQQVKSGLADFTEKEKILVELQKNPNISKIAEIAEKYIPKKAEAGELVIELTAMAQANNLKVEETSMEKQSTTPKAEETTTETKTSPTPAPAPAASGAIIGVSTVDFTMKVTGSFSDFLNFLRAIDTSSRLISLKNITMQQKTGANQTTSFTAQISGSAYYKSKVDITSSNENLKVTDNLINKFLNLKTYGQPINLPSESGFGRSNPFETY